MGYFPLLHVRLRCEETGLQKTFRDRSLFITGGGGGSEDFGGDHLIFRRTEGGSVVTESPKGGITENFGRIQRGDHSNLLEQCQFESIQHKCAHSADQFSLK